MSVFKNVNDWNTMSESQLQEYQKQVFDYYRKNGYPYLPTDDRWRKEQLQDFLSFEDQSVCIDDKFQQTMHGLSYCWSFMPHSFNVKCGNKKTPLEAFNDDDTLKKIIKKCIFFQKRNMSDTRIRSMSKIVSGVQGVSNFRPTTATCIYNKFAKGKVVWDMSCGYGGRMLGAIKSGVKKYIGTEPCTVTYENLINMYEKTYELMQQDSLFPIEKMQIDIRKIGSQDFVPQSQSIDFCFTSPPYFNTQKYSEQETQSWKRYDTKETWLNDFLKKTFCNCYIGLKSGCYMLINIANVSTYLQLQEDTVRVAEQVGFKLQKTYRYALSGLSKREQGQKYKYQPMFLFKKP